MKPGQNNRHTGEIKYGVKVLRNFREAYAFDKANNNDLGLRQLKKKLEQ